jgi:hypothetical protein
MIGDADVGMEVKEHTYNLLKRSMNINDVRYYVPKGRLA